jgi:hypothetical protein
VLGDVCSGDGVIDADGNRARGLSATKGKDQLDVNSGRCKDARLMNICLQTKTCTLDAQRTKTTSSGPSDADEDEGAGQL